MDCRIIAMHIGISVQVIYILTSSSNESTCMQCTIIFKCIGTGAPSTYFEKQSPVPSSIQGHNQHLTLVCDRVNNIEWGGGGSYNPRQKSATIWFDMHTMQTIFYIHIFWARCRHIQVTELFLYLAQLMMIYMMLHLFLCFH